EGEDLAAHLAKGAIPLATALPIALQLAQGLEQAHDRGIVHRDLKPANVMVGPDGRVKILDFGLAKAFAQEAASGPSSLSMSPTLTAQMTQAGTLLGTAAYMSPEQARGEEADRRTDIWAFGTVLMEMLTGNKVFPGKTVSDSLAGILAREPDWEALPGDLPRPIRRLLERCLEKEVTDRLQAIGEARIAIERYLTAPEAEEQAVAPGVLTPARWMETLPAVGRRRDRYCPGPRLGALADGSRSHRGHSSHHSGARGHQFRLERGARSRGRFTRRPKSRVRRDQRRQGKRPLRPRPGRHRGASTPRHRGG
ncbi:MAG: protein kinase, partial [Gammaproteobacteria bacterium]|nr:protein kinase [Gammaproteobacteria bacterium]